MIQPPASINVNGFQNKVRQKLPNSNKNITMSLFFVTFKPSADAEFMLKNETILFSI